MRRLRASRHQTLLEFQEPRDPVYDRQGVSLPDNHRLLWSFGFLSVCFIHLISVPRACSAVHYLPAGKFIFTAPHAYIEVETGPFGLLGDWPDAPGLQNCLPCDPRANLTLLYDSGNTGLMQFDAISFVSSLAPNGDLKVIYTATAQMFFETDQYGNLCDPGADSCLGPNLVWNRNIHWLVTAQFAPDSSNPGNWSFLDATFTPAPTPEPSSILLVGSGIVILIMTFRRKQANV